MNKIFAFLVFLNEPLFVYKKHWFLYNKFANAEATSYFTIFSSFPHFSRKQATLLHIIVFFSFLQILIIIISFACICIHCCCCSIDKSCGSFETSWMQHARHPCPLLSSWVCSNSCPLSWWCHLTISANVTHFSSYP